MGARPAPLPFAAGSRPTPRLTAARLGCARSGTKSILTPAPRACAARTNVWIVMFLNRPDSNFAIIGWLTPVRCELALADSQPLPSLGDLLLKHQAAHFLLDRLPQTPLVNLVFEPVSKRFLGFCRSHKYKIYSSKYGVENCCPVSFS